jgi:hypothetical protein
MGRVARYKKVKKTLSKATPNGAERISIHNTGKDSKGGLDYFDRVGVWGLGDSGRKPKKRSLASLKLRAQRNKKIPATKECYDLACTEGDDFDLNDLVGSLKKESQPPEVQSFTATSYSSTKGLVCSSSLAKDHTPSTSLTPSVALEQSKDVAPTDPTIAVDDEKLHKKLESQVKPKVTIVKSEGRMPGESKRAYSKRVKLETRQIIQRSNQLDQNPMKRQKKKEFLTQKKKSGKKRKGSNNYIDGSNDNVDNEIYVDNNDSHDKDTLLTGEQAVAARERATRVQFGEQADRPPTFKQLPRAAVKIAKKQKTNETSSTSSFKTDHDIEAEQLAMELMRRKVQAQYAEIKARRRIHGDFHL